MREVAASSERGRGSRVGSRRRGTKAAPQLSERQRYWLQHIRAAERAGEPLKHYAKRNRLSEHSLYEAKRRLRELGVIAPVAPRRTGAARFARVAVSEAPRSCPLRARLASGAVLEWSEAPRGEALRELIGALS